MVWIALLLMALGLVAGSTPVHREAIAVKITADPPAGTATLTCRQSSSGTCHALFLTGSASRPFAAAQGMTVQIDGVTSDTQFCIAATPPDAATCKPAPLRSGTQIVRHERNITG